MAVEPSQLSVEELRRRFLQEGEAVTNQLLVRLRRDPRRGVRTVYQALRRQQERHRRERLRLDALLHFEQLLWRAGLRHVAGVDEAGVGPLAGPVVAAAVVFPPGTEIAGVDDSKRLSAERREELASVIHERATGVGLGRAEVEEIDRLNVYHAALLAMRRAVDALPERPEHLLLDAREIPDIELPQSPFTRGDGLSFSIAAASIVAKTHRDRLMDEIDRAHPGYGFARHKGYATEDHREAIRRLGPSPVHRTSFEVFRELCGEYSSTFYDLRRRLDRATTEVSLAEVEAAVAAAELEASEQRKLRLLVARRWKTV